MRVCVSVHALAQAQVSIVYCLRSVSTTNNSPCGKITREFHQYGKNNIEKAHEMCGDNLMDYIHWMHNITYFYMLFRAFFCIHIFTMPCKHWITFPISCRGCCHSTVCKRIFFSVYFFLFYFPFACVIWRRFIHFTYRIL